MTFLTVKAKRSFRLGRDLGFWLGAAVFFFVLNFLAFRQFEVVSRFLANLVIVATLLLVHGINLKHKKWVW